MHTKSDDMDAVQTKMEDTYSKIRQVLEYEEKGNIKKTISFIALNLGFTRRTASSYFHTFLDSGIIKKSYSNRWVWVGTTESLTIIGSEKQTTHWKKGSSCRDSAPQGYTQHPGQKFNPKMSE